LKNFENVYFSPADILIPKKIDMKKWSIVACDQYTSQPDYWKKVESIAGENPSALHITLPEIYLENENVHEKISSINKTMQNYLENDIFTCFADSFIYVERKLPTGKTRKGLVGAVDLEAYDYTDGAKNHIRATEKTVIDRIPPRVKIRENAPLELPHVMLLINDKEKSIIEQLEYRKNEFEVVYDFELMQNGGHITGYRIPRQSADSIYNGLLEQKSKSSFMYAVGDGNHSLAAAKVCWERIKKTQGIQQHSARYALAELVNIYDDSLLFEPIHRVLFNCNPKSVLESIFNMCPIRDDKTKGQPIKYMFEGESGVFFIDKPTVTLAISELQSCLDGYIAANNCKIDYIHGDDAVESLSQQKENIGFILPAMEKAELFSAVVENGVLPRKTFSMGSADEKRYYLECRKLF